MAQGDRTFGGGLCHRHDGGGPGHPRKGAARSLLGLRSSDFTVACDGASFTFTVRGYGHGVGLSQYGADYLARQGATFDEILAHYYPGATLGVMRRGGGVLRVANRPEYVRMKAVYGREKGKRDVEFAKRMDRFGEGIFSVLLGMKKEQLAQGRHVVDLSVGTPNIPPAQHVIDALVSAAQDRGNYVYAMQRHR